jgi:hypothetical protein
MVCKLHLLTTKSQGLLVRETANVLCVPYDQGFVQQALGRVQHRSLVTGVGIDSTERIHWNHVDLALAGRYNTMSSMSIDILLKV